MASPCRALPFRGNIHPVTWRVVFDYGGSNLAVWGVHLVDIIQLALKLVLQNMCMQLAASTGRTYASSEESICTGREISREVGGWVKSLYRRDGDEIEALQKLNDWQSLM